MKGLLLSSALALGMGAFAMAPANAAPISTHATIVAPAATSDVACRTVTKTVYRNGVKKVVQSRSCDSGGYVVERRRHDYRGPGYYHRPRPGVHIGIGVR